MDPFPLITTPRLALGQLSYTDIPQIIAYAGDAKVSATTLNIPHPYREEDAVFWINSANSGFRDGTQYTFAIRLQATDEFIGGIGLKLQQAFDRGALGYWIGVPFWNKGYTTEAVAGLLCFGFDTLHLNKIYATHLVENPASSQVMIKNGMIKEGELKDHTKKDGVYQSLIQYRLTKAEYEGLNTSLSVK